MRHKDTMLDVEQIWQAISQKSADSYPLQAIHYFERLNSTNDWLLEHGKPGDICIAEEQTAGKGRRGNQWLSPNCENIYCSLVYQLNSKTQHQSLLGLVVSLAIAEALADVGMSGHAIKWPNDIYFFAKKVGGVLIETSNQSNTFIIGIGLNYQLPEHAQQQIDQDVASIVDIMADTTPTRELVIVKLLQSLSIALHHFTHFDFEAFKHNWHRWDILRDELVSFEQNGELISGIVTDIDQHGRLGILHSNQQLQFYSSADIRLNKRQ